jgi:uncharacterized protein YkwD
LRRIRISVDEGFVVRSRSARLLAFIVFSIALSGAPPAAAGASPAERTLLAAINDARSAHGRAPLRFGTTIQAGAHSRAGHLLDHDLFLHGQLLPGSSENLAWLTCRAGWARRVVNMWLASPGHRANLLDGSARRAGIGVARGAWTTFPCVRMVVARSR